MKLRTKIHSVTEDRAQLLGKAEITQTYATESAGGKLRQHIDITSLRIEIVA